MIDGEKTSLRIWNLHRNEPASETEGKRGLAVIGNVFSNLPDAPKGYVRRTGLETEIQDTLLDDRHPVVTLVGRGGIGKTSLALTVLHEITKRERYYMIVWFSARDIDLHPKWSEGCSTPNAHRERDRQGIRDAGQWGRGEAER